ncbi:MAG: 50S ribosomal protein L10 [Deltaproteobacteria bacterium]|nr:50S ribosomal protein L10 [Deltaproteobacteria bacterium]
MPRVEKEKAVQDIQEKFKKAQAVFLFEYHGLNVTDMTGLRMKLREGQGELKVLKNTLVKKALEGSPLKETVASDFKGPIACAFSYADAVSTAKVLVDFKKEDQSLNFKSGVLKEKKIQVQEIKALAKLPSREVLLAHLVGTLAAPISSFVNVLAAVPRKFLYALRAVEEKKGKS